MIRSGEPVENVINHVRRNGFELNGKADLRSRAFLLALVQTTASLPELVHLASSMLRNAQFASNLPEPAACETLKRRVERINLAERHR